MHNRKPPLIIPTLDPPEPKHLPNLPPKSNRRIHKGSLVRINKGPLPDQISLVGFDKLSLLDDLPDEEEGRDDDLHGVV